VRLVAVDERLRLDIDRLRSMVDADRAAGARPFMLVATAGTTGSGMATSCRTPISTSSCARFHTPYDAGSWP
jgi:hypothetical protein